MAISVAILDDHRSFAEAISLALALRDDITPVGIANTIDEFVGVIRETQPEVLLVDYQLSGETGIDGAARMREVGGDPRLILLTAFASVDVTSRALAQGFERVVSKDGSVEHIVEAVRRPPTGAEVRAPETRLSFSRRQREVLELMGQGLDPASIADQLFISVHTARSHVKDVLRVLGASSQLSAVTKAIRLGYLLPPS